MQLSSACCITAGRKCLRKGIETIAQRADTKPLTHGVIMEVLVHSVFLLLPLGLKENTRNYAEFFRGQERMGCREMWSRNGAVPRVGGIIRRSV